jgi:hypothetical protein
MASILDQVSRQLDPGTINTISRQLGVDPQAAQQAVSLALPMLIGGMAKNVEQPGGAASLESALGEHSGTLENMAAIFGNPSAGPGAGILGHILGGRQPKVENGIGSASGLDPQKVSQLLMMLAPIVMGVLAKHRQNAAAQPGTAQPGTAHPGSGGGIETVLRNEKKEIERRVPGMGGVLGGIFDQNKDGNVGDDLARIAQSGSLGGLLGGLLGGKR